MERLIIDDMNMPFETRKQNTDYGMKTPTISEIEEIQVPSATKVMQIGFWDANGTGKR